MVLIAPITALEFNDGFLFAGEGPYLKCYHLDTKRPITQQRVLSSANIHGIKNGPLSSSGEGLVVVYGAKSAAVIKTKTKDETRVSHIQFEVIRKHEFQDRILTCSWLDEKEEEHLALVTAHNVILRWDWKKGIIIATIHSEEKCILYSALIMGGVWRDLVVAGGTVFNQVVLWGACGQVNTSGRQRVFHRLDGHQGVIFALTYSRERGEICSVSDDRSIRIWRVVLSENQGPPVLIDDWSQSQFLPLHVLYGHTARVWDARYHGDLLVSVGEDSTCCVWNDQGKVIKRYKGHKGKSIWSLAVERERGRIATGGGDCGISLWSLDDTDMKRAVTTTLISPPPDLLPEGGIMVPKVTRLMDQNDVFIISDEGVLYKYEALRGEWSVAMRDEAYKSYSLMEVSPDGSTVCLGNIFGQICLITQGRTSRIQCYGGKVFSIIWLKDDLIITTGPEGRIDVWEVVRREGEVAMVPHVDHVLPEGRQRWVSAAVWVEDTRGLVCGDRAGSVHVYDTTQKGSGPVLSFWKVHGKAGVTDIRVQGDFIYTAGRDGKYRQFQINNSRLELLHSTKALKGFEWIARILILEDDLHLIGFYTDRFIVYNVGLNQTRLSIPCGGGHRAWDFKINDNQEASFVYIKAGQVEMCSTNIQTDHILLKPALHGREVTDVVHLASFPSQTGYSSVLATSSEDTMINIISVNYSEGESKSYSVIASIQGHLSSVRALAVSPITHSQNTESVKHTNSNQTTSLLFSGGGRAELMCCRLTFEPKKPSQAGVGEPVTPRCQYEHLATHNLCQKGRHNRKPWRRKVVDSNPETRFMSLTAFRLPHHTEGTSDVHFVAAACSDAFVRLFAFHESTRSFHLLAQTDYHRHCVLSVSHFYSQNTDSVYVCSAGSDGRVAVWNMSQLVESYLQCSLHQCSHDRGDGHTEGTGSCLTDGVSDFPPPELVISSHQSGVNSIDVQLVKEGTYLLVTGGDDNCLSVHTIIMEGGHLTLQSSGQKSDAHGAQINGVYILDGSKVMSVSIDQRLITWTITPDLNVEYLSGSYIDVADVSRMRCWKTRDHLNTVVSGVGLQFV